MTDISNEALDALETRLRFFSVCWGEEACIAPHPERHPGITTGTVIGAANDATDAITALRAEVARLNDAHVQALTISPDLSAVRAMLDAAEDKWAHLSTVAATIRVNALRHGATDAQVEAFIRGDADFIAWLSDKVQAGMGTARLTAAPQEGGEA
jgi:hypothetical protein